MLSRRQQPLSLFADLTPAMLPSFMALIAIIGSGIHPVNSSPLSLTRTSITMSSDDWILVYLLPLWLTKYVTLFLLSAGSFVVICVAQSDSFGSFTTSHLSTSRPSRVTTLSDGFADISLHGLYFFFIVVFCWC